MMKKVYLAGPLFNEMELAFNADFATRIRETYPDVELFVPQEQGDINNKESYADSKMIAQLDTQAVLESDLMIAVLDGQIIDPGVASEIGVAYQAGIPVLGLYSDTRQQGATNQQKLDALQEVAESQFSYINLYTIGLIKLRGEVLTSSQDIIDKMSDYL